MSMIEKQQPRMNIDTCEFHVAIRNKFIHMNKAEYYG